MLEAWDAAVNNYPLVQEDWISVEDELPKEKKLVIIGYSNRLMNQIGYECYYQKGKWYKKDGSLIISHNAITHWRDSPKPPITKKRGGCNP